MAPELSEALAALTAGGSPAASNAALRKARDALGVDGLISGLRQALPGISLPATALGTLGAFLRASRPAIGAPLMLSTPPLAPAFVNVLGTSHVRVFGCRPYFFPVFAGMGPDMMLLTDASAEAAGPRIIDNFLRLDTRQDTLLVLSGEALCHVLNYHKTRPAEGGPVTETDRQFMRDSLARYDRLLPQLRRNADARLALLNALPTYDPVLNELARMLNEGLKPICAEHGVHFIDVWDQLTEPDTGLLRREMAAEAYNDDVHLSETAMPVLEAALREIGFLTPVMEESPPAPWSYVFTLPVSPGVETRLWSETNVIPANAFRSEKVAAAFVAQKALEYLLPQLLAHGAANLLLPNAREAFIANALPPGFAKTCTSLIETEGQMTLARRIAAFCGRTDLNLQRNNGLSPLPHYEFVLAMLHPDALEAELRLLHAVLTKLSCGQVMIVAPGAASIEPLRQLGYQPRGQVTLGNRLLPERWRETVLFL